MTIREDDAELLAALTNWARNLKYGPDQDWLETAVDRITALSSEREILRERVKVLEEALRVFAGSAYPVAEEINPRGHNWSEAYLDQALPIARAALDTGVTGG